MKNSKTPRIFIQENLGLSIFSQITFREITNNNSFKNLYSSLTLYLIKELSHAPNNSDLELVLVCYHNFLNIEGQKFTFLVTSEDKIFKLLKINNPRKEADLSNLPVRLLKNGVVVLDFLIKTM